MADAAEGAHLAFSADTSHSLKCSVRMRASAWCALNSCPDFISSAAAQHSPSSCLASPTACRGHITETLVLALPHTAAGLCQCR